ncbi:MAG TPA: response regulator [Chitinophagaceae bacterium]|jgi:CheY-like chemotaxis protein|nr:response regulator [Chitinophagaceae bacterium]
MQEIKILLADDDVEDRSIIQDAMESLDAGDVMMFADNGAQLLDLLKNNFTSSVCPCLIVLDLNMPKMSGTETLSRLKTDETFKHIPVIIYSTSINPLEKEKCLSLGAHSFITKPISFKESRETAKSFLQFRQSKTIV